MEVLRDKDFEFLFYFGIGLGFGKDQDVWFFVLPFVVITYG